ncbi:MAG: hypothetical protein A3J27_04815, partial [Candidatus Tectomicrobia bacterium RIFCSPLOWO2_12_FULL_69_37]
KHLGALIQGFGGWTHAVLFLIVFAETGLVVTPFLPGDSLLFAVGTFAALGALDVTTAFAVLTAAAILGDSLNYRVGRSIGERVLAHPALLARPKYRGYVERTERFYERHGAKTIVLARFVPIVRTFAPFVAGVGRMHYATFLFYNVAGGVLWVAVLVFGGYFFGNIPIVRRNFTLVILAIVVLSVLPVAAEYWRHRREAAREKAR